MQSKSKSKMSEGGLLIAISKDIIRRNILDTPFWDTFVSNLGDNKVVLVVDQPMVSEISDKYEGDFVKVVGYERQKHVGFQKIINFLIRTGINSHSTRTYRNRAFKRGQSSRVSYYTKGFLANVFGSFNWYKRFLRWLFLKTKSPKSVYDIFDKYNPDAVFTPSMIDNEFDAQFARVAKQRKCKLVGMVRSWDNLNNHGVLSVVPDVWYFQNVFLEEMAEKMQGIKLESIDMRRVGLPHYDIYRNPSDGIKKREDFFEDFGLDASKKLIFLGGSDFYYSEDDLPKLLNNIIEEGEIYEPVQVVFRPHPSSLFGIEEYGLGNLKHIHLNDAFRGGAKFRDADVFLNLMYHSDIVMNIASTMSIDAAVFGKPAICINFDSPGKKLSKFESVHRLYDHFDHYERLVGTGGVRAPDSLEALVADINLYLENPSIDSEGQKKIIETFISPFDGKASQRLAEFVTEDMLS